MNKVKEILIPTLSLFVICLVVTLLLGVTNQVTAPMIEQRAVQTEQEARQKVLSAADSFDEQKTADGTVYYEGKSQDALTGYVFIGTAKGYGDEIVVMVGVDTNGVVTGIEYLNLAETAGLGMNAKKPAFMEQFAGKQGEIGVAKSSPKDNEIQALTGATITSKAVTAAVNNALDLYEEVANNG